MKPNAASDKHGLGVVFNPDYRQRINPTAVMPYFWIGQLEIKFPQDKGSNRKWVGTGTLIGSRHVLTCAHNLYDPAMGGYATSVDFYPKRNGGTGTKVSCVSWLVPDEYVQSPPPQPNPDGSVDGAATQYLSDFGLVGLSEDVNPSGDNFPAMFAASDFELTNRPYDIAGYPADKAPANTMWNCAGMMHSGNDELLFYEISTYGGQSGSAVRGLFPPKNPHFPNIPWIVGIHVAGRKKPDGAPDINFAVRLKQDVINEITSWM